MSISARYAVNCEGLALAIHRHYDGNKSHGEIMAVELHKQAPHNACEYLTEHRHTSGSDARKAAQAKGWVRLTEKRATGAKRTRSYDLCPVCGPAMTKPAA